MPWVSTLTAALAPAASVGLKPMKMSHSPLTGTYSSAPKWQSYPSLTKTSPTPGPGVIETWNRDLIGWPAVLTRCTEITLFSPARTWPKSTVAGDAVSTCSGALDEGSACATPPLTAELPAAMASSAAALTRCLRVLQTLEMGVVNMPRSYV